MSPVCQHKRTIHTSGMLGTKHVTYLLCEDCGKRLEDDPDLGKWLRKALDRHSAPEPAVPVIDTKPVSAEEGPECDCQDRPEVAP